MKERLARGVLLLLRPARSRRARDAGAEGGSRAGIQAVPGVPPLMAAELQSGNLAITCLTVSGQVLAIATEATSGLPRPRCTPHRRCLHPTTPSPAPTAAGNRPGSCFMCEVGLRVVPAWPLRHFGQSCYMERW